MKTALFLLNPRFNYHPNSPLQYSWIDFSREAEGCDPLYSEHILWPPLLKKRDHHPGPEVLSLTRHMMSHWYVNQDSATTLRDLRYLGQISSIPGALPLRSFWSTSVISAWVMVDWTSESLASASSTKECQLDWGDSSTDKIPRCGELPQLLSSTVNSVGRALLPPLFLSRNWVSKISPNDCHPVHNVPAPYVHSCGWLAYGKAAHIPPSSCAWLRSVVKDPATRCSPVVQVMSWTLVFLGFFFNG